MKATKILATLVLVTGLGTFFGQEALARRPGSYYGRSSGFRAFTARENRFTGYTTPYRGQFRGNGLNKRSRNSSRYNRPDRSLGSFYFGGLDSYYGADSFSSRIGGHREYRRR